MHDLEEFAAAAGGRTVVVCHRLSATTIVAWMLAAYIGALGARFTYDVVHDHPRYDGIVKEVRKHLP